MKLKFFFHRSFRGRNCHFENWIMNGLIDFEYKMENDDMIWIQKENDILLWSADECYNGKGININNIDCSHKIMMNLVLPNTIPSFYASRNEMLMNKYMEENPPKTFHQRKNNTIFIGSRKNAYQGSFRDPAIWEEHIDEFFLSNNGESGYRYNQIEYYNALANTKFGVSLRGGGPKCWRDIEYLALGTVLIATEGVDTDDYHNPLVENVHYIKCKTPEEMKEKISKISEEKWSEMSKKCIEWYYENSHYKGSIKILENIVSKLS